MKLLITHINNDIFFQTYHNNTVITWVQQETVMMFTVVEVYCRAWREKEKGVRHPGLRLPFI